MRSNKKIRGFTLVELLTAVVVSAILISIAIPSFRSLQERNAVGAVSNDLLADVLLARSEAVKREQRVAVVPAGSSWGEQGWRVFVDVNTNDAWNDGTDVLLKSNVDSDFSNANYGVQLSGSGNAARFISFDPRGRTTQSFDSSSFISAQRGDSSRYICFSPTGRPLVVKELNGGSCP